jgi:hypothetical protein
MTRSRPGSPQAATAGSPRAAPRVLLPAARGGASGDGMDATSARGVRSGVSATAPLFAFGSAWQLGCGASNPERGEASTHSVSLSPREGVTLRAPGQHGGGAAALREATGAPRAMFRESLQGDPYGPGSRTREGLLEEAYGLAADAGGALAGLRVALAESLALGQEGSGRCVSPRRTAVLRGWAREYWATWCAVASSDTPLRTVLRRAVAVAVLRAVLRRRLTAGVDERLRSRGAPLGELLAESAAVKEAAARALRDVTNRHAQPPTNGATGAADGGREQETACGVGARGVRGGHEPGEGGWERLGEFGRVDSPRGAGAAGWGGSSGVGAGRRAGPESLPPAASLAALGSWERLAASPQAAAAAASAARTLGAREGARREAALGCSAWPRGSRGRHARTGQLGSPGAREGPWDQEDAGGWSPSSQPWREGYGPMPGARPGGARGDGGGSPRVGRGAARDGGLGRSVHGAARHLARAAEVGAWRDGSEPRSHSRGRLRSDGGLGLSFGSLGASRGEGARPGAGAKVRLGFGTSAAARRAW